MLSWSKRNLDILTNSSSMMATTTVTSGLGFLYWVVAARLFDPADVGIASALVSAIMFLGTFGMLGLGTLLIRELACDPESSAELLASGMLFSGLAAALLGLTFWWFVPYFAPDLGMVLSSLVGLLVFVVGTALTASTNVLDEAVIGLLRGDVQFARNALFSVVKLGLLVGMAFLMPGYGSIGILLTWIVAIIISLAAVARGRLVVMSGFLRPRFDLVRHLGVDALGHHVLNLSLSAPGRIFPIVVTAMISAEANASFYAAWMIAGLVWAIAIALTTVLYATGSAHPEDVPAKAKSTFALASLVSLGAVVILWFGARPILGVFGEAYAEQATTALRLLALSSLPSIVETHFVASLRIRRQTAKATKIVLAGILFELGLGTLGLHLAGLTGLAAGYLGALCLESIYMAPTVYHMITGTKSWVLSSPKTTRFSPEP